VKTRVKKGQSVVDGGCKTSVGLMTSVDESSKEKFTVRSAAHSWGVIRPAIEAKIGCINVTTLGQENEGRELIVCRSLGEYGLDICGISETKWKGKGTRDVIWTENGKKQGYTIFYSGVGEKEKAYGGVAIAVKSSLASSVSAWDAIDERLMWVRFNADNVPTTFISCYAPTDVAEKKDKDSFYDVLERIIQEVPGRDSLVVFGDFNARVGRNNKSWEGVLGMHGLNEEMTDNGRRLLELCSSHSLCVASTFFRHKRVHKYTHYSRNAQHTKSQIDHILVRKRWITSVRDTRVYRGADFCGTDHRLLIARTMAKLKTKKPTPNHKINLDRLNDPNFRKDFELNVKNRFEALVDELSDTETLWSSVKEVTVNLALEVCGKRHKKRDEWLNEDIIQLAEKKKNLFKKWLSVKERQKNVTNKVNKAQEEYKKANRACIKAARRAKAEYVERKGKELEEHTRRHNTRGVYQTIKELGGARGHQWGLK